MMSMKSTEKPQPGEYWKTCDGRVVGPLWLNHGAGTSWTLAAEIAGMLHIWTASGFYLPGQEPHGLDLIERVEAPAPAEVAGGGKERIGPRYSRATCKGCPAHQPHWWREPSGDGETYDSGTSARCSAAGGRKISTYNGSHPAPPEWCPATARQPESPTEVENGEFTAPAPAETSGREIVRHKNGGVYSVIGEAQAQTMWGIGDYDKLVIYRSHEDGSLWARPVEEFRDGRFEPIAAPVTTGTEGDVAELIEWLLEPVGMRDGHPVYSTRQQKAAQALLTLQQKNKELEEANERLARLGRAVEHERDEAIESLTALQQEVDKYKSNYVHQDFIFGLQDDLAASQAECERLRKVVMFFADEDNWIGGEPVIRHTMPGDDYGPAIDDYEPDAGRTALTASQAECESLKAHIKKLEKAGGALVEECDAVSLDYGCMSTAEAKKFRSAVDVVHQLVRTALSTTKEEGR